MNNNPFDEQHPKFSDAYQQQQQQQQHQQMNYVVDNSKAQWQPNDDAFTFWNSPNAAASSVTTSNSTATANSTLNILALHQQSQRCDSKHQPLGTSSSIPVYPTHSNVPTTHNYQFSGGPYPSSTTSSFDPFSAPPSTMPLASVVAAPPIAATQHQLVPMTQSEL
jgi:hypothetical protein